MGWQQRLSLRQPGEPSWPHLEDVEERAKAEIHRYMTGVVQRAGLEALTSGELPLLLDHKDED